MGEYCKLCGEQKMIYEQQLKEYHVRLTTYMGGLHWKYTNNKGDGLSVICHNGSYGNKTGLFETMCSWKEDVQGYLTFGQVQNKINTLIKKNKED